MAGLPKRKILGLWAGIAVVSGLAAGLGYASFSLASGLTGAFAQAFAAGAMLTMLVDTMMPEAFRFGGPQHRVVHGPRVRGRHGAQRRQLTLAEAASLVSTCAPQPGSST